MSIGVFGAQLTHIDQKNAVQPHLGRDRSSRPTAPPSGSSSCARALTFHNGKDVTATDVVETYNYHRGENTKSAVKSALDIVADIKADGPETVIFTLKSGSADFPYITSDYHLPIYPAKDGGGIEWEKGISAGPFILENYQPGVKATAKRNPNYFVADKPYFDDVEMLSIIDVTARTNALNTGEIHYMDRVDLKTIDLLKQNPESRHHQPHRLRPLCGADERARRRPSTMSMSGLALKWAIDRKELVDKILLGYGTPGNDNPIAPSIKYATNPEPVYQYDPDKAKFHLKKAGLETLEGRFLDLGRGLLRAPSMPAC